MSYLRELNKTTKTQQGLIFFTPLDLTSLHSENELRAQLQSRIFIFSVQCLIANLFFIIILHAVLEKVTYLIKIHPAMSQYTTFLLPSYILCDKATYPTILSFFLSRINSDCALPTNYWSLHRFLLLSRGGGGGGGLHFYHPCLVYFLSDVNALLLPKQEQAQPDERESYRRSPSLPSFNPLLSLDSLTLTEITLLH